MSAVTGHETEPAVVGAGTKPPLAVPRRLLRMRSDAALVERFAAGDESAFDVIYERHRPVVLAVSMGVLGTPQDAEDATQETFSALAVALRTRPPAELRPWLIRVARNASIDTTRRRRHRLLTLDGEIPEIAARPAGSGQAELAVVLDGIRELPEGQRMALLMRELGGHTYTEIAEFLETDEEAVKGLIARARVGLRSYREATELSCATARSTIEAEPDGRRYDKTIRRHLRGCGACRSYREALRDDAKALRAALPIQAGSVATGSLSSGLLSTAKGSLLGYGLTQAATTCATTACAVGAIGGMVFVGPVHRFGVQPILPATPPAITHKHVASARKPVDRSRAARTQASAPVTNYAQATTDHASVNYSKPAVTPGTTKSGHRHDPRQPAFGQITHVRLPKLPASSTANPTANPTATAASQDSQGAFPSWSGGAGGQGRWSQGSAGQQGNGGPGSGQSGDSQGPTQSSQWDSGQNSQGDGSSSGNPTHAAVTANPQAPGTAAPSTSTTSSASAATSNGAASGTTTPPGGAPTGAGTGSSSSSAWGNGASGQSNGASGQSNGASGQSNGASGQSNGASGQGHGWGNGGSSQPQGAGNGHGSSGAGQTSGSGQGSGSAQTGGWGQGSSSQGSTSQAGGSGTGSATTTGTSTSTGGSSHTGSSGWSHHGGGSSSWHSGKSGGSGSSQSPTWGNGHGSGSSGASSSGSNPSAWGS